MNIIDKLARSALLGLGMVASGAVSAACVDDYPLQTVTTDGGGQSASVNSTLTATFSGHFMTTDGLVNHGRNAVTVCPGTEVGYSVSSTVGEPTVEVVVTMTRMGPMETQIITPPAADCTSGTIEGYLAIGDKLSCNNKNLGGSDTDTFTVKAGR